TGTPQPIVDRLNSEIQNILKRDDVKEAWAKQGAEPMLMDPDEFEKYLRLDIEKWPRVVRLSGATAQAAARLRSGTQAAVHPVFAQLPSAVRSATCIGRTSSALAALVGAGPPLDHVAHAITFGEGPVWDRRRNRFLFTDIIGDTIWQWSPGVGQEILVHPSRH